MIDKPEKPRGVADRTMSPKVTPSTASALIASNEVTFYIPSNPFLFALLLTSQGGTMWQNALEPDDVVGSYSGRLLQWPGRLQNATWIVDGVCAVCSSPTLINPWICSVVVDKCLQLEWYISLVYCETKTEDTITTVSRQNLEVNGLLHRS